MAIERWGSLSVADHIDASSLAINVLLYDRLILPVMVDQPDRDERAYWEHKGWQPDLQRQRLDQLQELAISRPWDAARRAAFKTRLAALQAEQFDAQHIDNYHMTRMILAQEDLREKMPGVQHVDVLAAYNSAAALDADFALDENEGHIATQAYLLTRRLAVPKLAKPEDVLKLALELSRDPAFRDRRSALFDWQQTMAARGIPPAAAVDLLCELTDQYNQAVKAATTKVYWKLAFTVFGAGLGLVAGEPTLGAGLAAALSLVQFATFDHKPAVEATTAAPAAMFHDIEARVGSKLKGK